MLSTEDLTEKAIQSIAELTRVAAGADGKVAIVPIPNDPYKGFIAVRSDGNFEKLQPALAPRKTILHSVDQVAGFVDWSILQWKCTPVVYFSPRHVVVRLNDGEVVPTDNGGAGVELQYSEPFKLIHDFARNRDAAWRSHKAFMLMLRIDLETCIEPFALEQTVKACEAYEVEDGSRVQSTVTRNRESLGKDIRSELRSGAGEIPEQLVLRVRIFKDPALQARRQIVCKLETDPTNGGRFALLPLAEEVDRAIDLEMADLGDLLRSSINGAARLGLPGPDGEASAAPARLAVPVFYGAF